MLKSYVHKPKLTTLFRSVQHHCEIFSQVAKPPAPEQEGDASVFTIDETRTTVEQPPLYKVLLVNDDFTPMEFVVAVVMRFFRKSEGDAVRLMLAVHREGHAVVGIYAYEIAEMKTTQVNLYARKHEYPLLCKFERE